jgi:hypothetical protein
MILSLSNCSNNEFKEVVVGDHVFNVPNEHLIEERIPWLPQSKEKGLIFYMDSEMPVQNRIIVLVQSRNITCRDESASTELAYHCNNSAKHLEDVPINWEKVKKIQAESNSIDWKYVQKNKDGTLLTIASCFAMANGEDGLCTILGSYTDLVYSLGVEDSEISRIPEIKKAVSARLSSWDNGEKDE